MKRTKNILSYLWLGTFVLTAVTSNAIAAGDKAGRNSRWRASGEQRVTLAGNRIDRLSRFSQGIDDVTRSIKTKGPWWPIWRVNMVNDVRSAKIKNQCDHGGPWKYSFGAGTAVGARPTASAVDRLYLNLDKVADVRLAKDAHYRIQTSLSRVLKLGDAEDDSRTRRATGKSINSDHPLASMLARAARRGNDGISLRAERKPSLRDVRELRERTALNYTTRDRARAGAIV